MRGEKRLARKRREIMTVVYALTCMIDGVTVFLFIFKISFDQDCEM